MNRNKFADPVGAPAEAERLVRLANSVAEHAVKLGWDDLRMVQEMLVVGVPRDVVAVSFQTWFGRFAPAVCVSCGHRFKPKSQDSVLKIYCYGCEKNGRKPSPISDEQRDKQSARSIANVAVKRGKLTRKPCSKCSDARAEKHHADYSKPLEVSWLCRPCHMNQHAAEKAQYAGAAP